MYFKEDVGLPCLECILGDHIEGYPSAEFGEPWGKLEVEEVNDAE